MLCKRLLPDDLRAADHRKLSRWLWPDTDLPDDIDALKALVRAHAASAHANAQRVVELQDQLSSRVIEIEHLKPTIAKLRRMQFGRKSEKLERQIEQLELRLEDLQADEGAATRADSKKVQQRVARVPVANRCPITSNAKSVCIAPLEEHCRGGRWRAQTAGRRRIRTA